MTEEELNRKMEFIVEQQAQFAVDSEIARSSRRQRKADEPSGRRVHLAL